MARKTATKTFEQEFAALVAEAQRTRTMAPSARADLDRRSSGAHGAHGNGVRKTTAGGNKSRMGSRRAQRNAAVRDCA